MDRIGAEEEEEFTAEDGEGAEARKDRVERKEWIDSPCKKRKSAQVNLSAQWFFIPGL